MNQKEEGSALDIKRRVKCVRINDLYRFGPILPLRQAKPGVYFRCIEGLPEDAVLVGESIDPMAQDLLLFFQHESFPECPIGQVPLATSVVMESVTLPLMSTSLFRELTHLVRLLQPLEQEGRLPAGLATLNGARKALEEAREATFEATEQYLRATANEYLRDYESALAREAQAQKRVAGLEEENERWRCAFRRALGISDRPLTEAELSHVDELLSTVDWSAVTGAEA